ncbi:MAG TPA: AbrB/MazE/SpoVT family DNA-binding domain-containing protein [Anaerolineae bacterium]|nr:AbrB/MazE/SpoVT family DNA-binding domain-containing protein [Anaerolineae bacterium]
MDAVRITIAEDGSIIIPQELLEKLGLHPKEEVVIRDRAGSLIIQKFRESHLDEIGRLLKEGLQDAEWAEIEEARKDRCF